MKKISVCLLLLCTLATIGFPITDLTPDSVSAAVIQVTPPPLPEQQQDYQSEAARYRSGRGGFTGGAPAGRAPARAPADQVRNPGAGTPAGGVNRGGGFGFGGFFGGLAAGAIFASLFNPFGFGGGQFSLLGILIWGVAIFFIFRLFRRLRNTDR